MSKLELDHRNNLEGAYSWRDSRVLVELEQEAGMVVDVADWNVEHLLVLLLPVLHPWGGILGCPAQSCSLLVGCGQTWGH